MRSVTARRILIAERDSSSREALSEWFLRRGYGVEAASDGWEAWERIREGWPAARSSQPRGRVDLALLDLEMPRGGALGTIERTRAEGIEIPVILMTSREAWRVEEDLAVEDFFRIAFGGIYTRPIAVRLLLAAVEGIFARRLPVVSEGRMEGERQ